MKRVFAVLALIILICLPVTQAAQDRNEGFAAFKRELMPRVGKQITISGVLKSAKLGWLVSFKGWGVYIYSTRTSESRQMDALRRFSDQQVEVRGILHYSPQPAQPADALPAAVPPEHFYFDVAEARVSGVEDQQPPGEKPSTIQETKRRPLVVGVAPVACITTFHQFFTYLQKAEADIVKDESAQQRWLTKDLREALKQKIATFTDNDPDYPGNGTFIGSWDYPTTFSVIGSRRYDKRAVVEVWYEWGKKTNYPGDTRLSYFIFLLEGGTWKLDDVYTFRGDFASAESLSAYLRTK